MITWLKNTLDTIPYGLLFAAALLMALLPFQPEPHLLEKLRWLSQGALTRPIDILDLIWHSLPMLLLVIKFGLSKKKKG